MFRLDELGPQLNKLVSLIAPAKPKAKAKGKAKVKAKAA
jgi:hypothetical protein